MTTGGLLTWSKAESCDPQLSINSIVIRPDTSPQAVFLQNGGWERGKFFHYGALFCYSRALLLWARDGVVKTVRLLVQRDFS